MFKKIALLIVGTLLTAGAVAAQPVRLVSGPEYPPFADPNLPQGGMITEIVVAAFKAAGVETTEVVFEPWKRGYKAVLDVTQDATFPYVRNAEREAEVAFSDSIYEIEQRAVFKAGSGRDYTGPESLAGMTLCVPLGYAVSGAVAPLVEAGTVKVAENPSVKGCLQLVEAGRVDAFIGSSILLNQTIHEGFGSTDGFAFGSTPVERNAQMLIVGKGNPNADAILAKFNEGLAKLRQDGTWDEIVRRHLGAGAD